LTLVAELISELNATDEGDKIEAKEISQNSVGSSVFETISAFSNEPGLGGGVILLGVRRVESLFPIYEVSGISEPDKLVSDLVSACQTKFNVSLRPKVSKEVVDEKIVILVDVPEVDSHRKPVYIKKKGISEGTYRRIGSSDIKCNDDDLFALFSHRAEEPVDSRAIEEASWSDIDSDAVSAYRKARFETHPTPEELSWTDDELVYALRCSKKRDSTYQPTLAGVLLFGGSQSLRRLVPTCRVDYIRVPGRTWVSDPENRFDALELRGPLISLVPRVISAVLDDMPKSFSIGENRAQRTDKRALPEVVIREAVVNALMHRNYSTNQPIQVIRYTNRLEIRNPGYSLKSEERFDEPGSQIRNPAIAEVLHETRFAENKGSGIRVMRRVMAEAGLTPPTFDSDRESDTFTAYFLFHHFLDQSDLDWLSNFQFFGLSEEQLRALIFVREVGAIDNKSYRNLTGLDTLKASKGLSGLRDAELLTLKGGGSNAYYAPGESLLSFLTLEANSQGKSENSQDIGDSAHKVTFDSLPLGLKTNLKLLRIQKRRKREDVERFISQACKWRPLSSKELAELLQNNPTYVQQNYLGPMQGEGKLQYEFPEMVNHPNQRYINNPEGGSKGGLK